MFVHDNNVSVGCTVPLLTLHKVAYLQIAYGKLHSATFNNTLWWVRPLGSRAMVRGWVIVRVGPRWV